MSATRIQDLWSPAVWIKGIAEGKATFPSIFNSSVVVRTQEAKNIASGGGTSAEIPFFKDITDQDDEIQIEATIPSIINGVTAGIQKCPILNRVCQTNFEALAAAVSDSDPVGHALSMLTDRRLKQRQKTVISLLRGAFGTATGAALGNVAALASMRRTVATETTAGQGPANYFSVNEFITGKALLGELQNSLRNGVFFMHSVIKANLETADAANFKSGVLSGLPFTITTYRDIPVVLCDSLVRANTAANGFVYDSYLLTPGIIAYGEKDQVADTGDTVNVAALQRDSDKLKNTDVILDRTRFVAHLNGMRWGGSPAQQSATNTELQTFGNWSLALSSANRVGAVCWVTAG